MLIYLEDMLVAIAMEKHNIEINLCTAHLR